MHQRPPSANGESSTAMVMIKKENESLKQEIRGLKERVSSLTHELDSAISS
jgi:cell division septum initiation protein DivIVA